MVDLEDDDGDDGTGMGDSFNVEELFSPLPVGGLLGGGAIGGYIRSFSEPMCWGAVKCPALKLVASAIMGTDLNAQKLDVSFSMAV